MRRRLLKLGGALLLAGALLLLAGGYWLLHSEPGSRWLLARVQAQLGAQLSLAAVDGDLHNGLELRDLSFSSENLELHAGQVWLTARLGLWPPRLALPRVHVQALSLHSSSAGQGESGRPDPAAWQLPLAVSIDAAELADVSWRHGDTAEPLVLDKLDFALSWWRTLELRALQLTAPGLAASASGELELQASGRHRLQLAIAQWRAAGLEGVELLLSGSLDQTRLQATADVPQLAISGPIEDPLGAMRMGLDWSLAGWPGLAPGWQLHTASGSITGTARDYRLRAESRLDTPLAPDLQMQLEAFGNLQALQLEALELSGPGLQARAAGSLDWSAQLQASGRLELEALDPSGWAIAGSEHWPAGLTLRGSARIDANPRQVRLDELRLEAGDRGAQLSGFTAYELDTAGFSGRLQWQNISWPLASLDAAVPADLTSSGGHLLLEGSSSDWRLEAQAELAAAAYPAGTARLAAHGSEYQASIDDLGIVALGGRVSGGGSVNWRDVLRAQAELELDGLDLATLDRRWPEALTGRLRLGYADQPRQLDIELQPVRGSWLGQAFTASGGLHWWPGAVRFEAVELNSERLTLSIDGEPLSDTGVRFDLQADGTPWLGSMGGGQLRAGGRAGLDNGLLQLNLDLAGQALTIGALSLEQVQASGSLAEGLDLQARQLAWQDTALDRLELLASNVAGAGRLEWRLHDGSHFLDGELRGEAVGPAQLQGQSWQGQLADLALGRDGRPLLELEHPATLQLAPGGLELADACLLAAGDGRACLAQLAWSRAGLQASGQLQAWPLDLLSRWIGSGLQMSQHLTGPFSFRREGAELPSGSAALNISAGRFRNPEQENELESAAGFIGFALDRGSLRDGQVDLRFPGVGTIDLDLAIDGVALDGSGRLDGRLRADVSDLSPLQLALPGIESLQGRLLVDLDLAGTSGDPQLAGDLQLSEAGFLVPLLGLRAWGVELQGRVTSRDRIEARGAGRIGDGRAELTLSAEFSDLSQPALQLALSGSDLRVIDLPDLSALADPDLQVGWRDSAATVAGRLLLHDARIAPLTSFVAAQEESPDLVIVNAEAQQAAPARNGPDMAVFGELEVRLGDAVRFESELAQASLAGELGLAWNGPLMPLAEGAIRISGEVSAYGPRLVMEDSFLRFNGGPASNPTLDISAERDIFGNTQLRAAGVRISGPASRPEVQAYTVPFTNEERAWALLITGSDLDYGQGIGAFDIGAYIAPRLYLSYGVSLFDSNNVVGIRYDLRKGFGIKATSGERESGIDATFTIDH